MPLTFGDTHPNAMPVHTTDVLFVCSLEADVARLEAEKVRLEGDKLRLQDEMRELHVQMRELHDQKVRLVGQVLGWSSSNHAERQAAELYELKVTKERLEKLVLDMRASRDKELTRMRCI